MWKALALILVAMALAAAAYLLLQPPAPTRVATIPVSRGDISNSLQLTGTVINDRTVTITALLDGEITAINAREGDTVEKDQVLSELDNQIAKAQLDKAEADLLYHRNSLSLINTGYERLSKLHKKGNASRQSLDDKLLEKRAAQSAVKVAQAELAIRELQLANSSVSAPFAGTITLQTVETGQWVEAGTQLFELVAGDGNVIEFQVDAEDASRIAVGQAVKLSSESWPDRPWSSEVTWLAPGINRSQRDGGNSNAFSARVELGEGAPPLLLNQQLDVELTIDAREDVLVIEQRLLELGPEGYRVFTYQEGNAVLKEVETGLFSIDEVEITNGLSANEQIIVPPTMGNGESLSDGDSVELAE